MFGVEFLTASAGWDLGTFLGSAETTLSSWIGAAITILGIVAVAFATWQIVSGLMSQGKKQINWALSIILLLVGGVLSVGGGFEFMQQVAGGGQKTIEDLGGQTIMLFEYSKMFSIFK